MNKNTVTKNDAEWKAELNENISLFTNAPRIHGKRPETPIFAEDFEHLQEIKKQKNKNKSNSNNNDEFGMYLSMNRIDIQKQKDNDISHNHKSNANTPSHTPFVQTLQTPSNNVVKPKVINAHNNNNKPR